MTNAQDWSYSNQAKYYAYRPNYSPAAIDELCSYVKARADDQNYLVADVGAGTGNLTIMLLERNLKCIAIEPTKEMMEIGLESTKNKNVKWLIGTGENTTLKDQSIDWYTMGSSFNTTDRLATLREAHRVLKPGGYFSCMWNHRDLETDPIQKEVEQIIFEVVPNYERGVRREGQADFILDSKLFNDIHYIEKDQRVEKTLEEYLNAWRSVKNKFWDFETEAGRATFERIVDKISRKFSNLGKMTLTYTTKIWTAEVIK